MLLRLFPVIALALTAHAQPPQDGDTPQSAGQLLAARLKAAASMSGASFEAQWRWPRSASRAAQAGAVLRVAGAGVAGRDNPIERATGRFRDDVFSVRIDRKQPIELVQAGRFTITRSGDDPWRASGSHTNLGFIPDPQVILRLLATQELAVLDRSIGERNGAAVELIAVSLTHEQVRQLVDAGAIQLPNPMLRSIERLVEIGRIPKSKVPLGVVDIGFEFDVTSRHLTQLRVRALSEQVDLRAIVRNRARGAAPEPVVDDGKPRVLPAPTKFSNGLPVRDTDGMEERTFELSLTAHDAVEPIQLDKTQRLLLGR